MRHLFVAATLAIALPFAGLPGQFEKIAPAAKGRVGVAAQLLESGETAKIKITLYSPGFVFGIPAVFHSSISRAVFPGLRRFELDHCRNASHFRRSTLDYRQTGQQQERET